MITKKKQRRIKSNFSYENALIAKGYSLVIGVDEAGRGPLAGPVVAAAVILNRGQFDHRIEDSKSLTPDLRDQAFFEIKQKSRFAVGMVNHRQIDRINILQATLLAMRKAVLRLIAQLAWAQQEQVFVIVDGNARLNLKFPAQSIVKGDTQSKSIAAASIIAKVTRDRLMQRFEQVYPGYGFSRHKGYPTLEHRLTIKRIGPSPIHRRSFLGCLERI